MRRTRFTALVLSVALSAFSAFAGRVTVANVTAVQRPADPIVDIYYDLLDPSGGVHTVTINASTNSGATYLASSTNFSGAVGTGVTIGTHKQVVWFAARDLPGAITTKTRVRVTANDLRADASDMLSIPPGTFTMGDSFGDGPYFDRPTHVVSVSAFSMDKCEVTSQKWHEVRTWALTHGYAFDHAGLGKAANHPVQTVSWYDCVKWCNARSEKEGLTPCYYTDAGQTTVYRSGPTNSPTVNWNAGGYRLPTEAEWEFAARGGAVGMRFPWSDANTITNSRANYFGTNVFAYDLGPIGNNPLFTPGGIPYTSPVGYFAPNGYGLYDMAGNVWEWCWDWFGDTWYSSAGATQNDPRGPAGGNGRILRGGDWDYYANLCRVAARNYNGPHLAGYYFGFRCVRAEIMVPIPAGSFTMGDSFGEGSSDEVPTHWVSVSAFSMDKCEVTSQKWHEVRTWALAHGYAFDYAGLGKAANHPVQTVSWYDCVKWCNARSEKEGLTPCYYTNAAQTLVYRGGQANLSNEWVNWNANGYRLPTEAEWEFAARGGAVGMRFPWSDANTITTLRANYDSYPPGYPYDLGPQGYNPAFTNAPLPYTSPAGYFAQNGYGLYDMAGNVWEWCWDRYSETWYSNAGATQNDSRGPANGNGRIVRGGAWDYYATTCRVAKRNYNFPYNATYYFGFRCVRAGAAASTCSISGSVSGDTQSGVTINLTGSAVASTTTAAGGGYSFSGLANGNYTVTPSKSGYTFSPANRSVTISGANQTGKDFAATQSGGGVDMVLIPAGAFQMGTNNLAYESELTDAGPRHQVTLSAFYMDKYEVTRAKWDEVYSWARSNGFWFDHDGTGSKAANHPVQTVNWYDCVIWCNARSVKEGLTPCYYTDAAQMQVYYGGKRNLSNEWVKWTANGYRLPTEAEWEKAARGGAAGMRFPWSDANTITNARASYYGAPSSHTYDLGPQGNNPLFTPGGEPYTSPVGYFAPNGYGLYDMAGNVEEWCWDYYDDTYYSISPASDPPGPASAKYVDPTYGYPIRVVRGGSWYIYLSDCRVAYRDCYTSTRNASYAVGFRCVRR